MCGLVRRLPLTGMTEDQEHAKEAKMAQVTFGLFDWIDRGKAPLHQLYEERLQLLEAADAAGFFGYHLAEHHATPLGMAPSPALFLTAAVQRTRRIRLGPLVYLLPLYHPLRLIFGSPARVREQMAQLLEVSGCNYVLGAFAWGTFPHAQTLRSLRLFAEEVMPAFAGSAVPLA